VRGLEDWLAVVVGIWVFGVMAWIVVECGRVPC
jgi:hypothetical protein